MENEAIRRDYFDLYRESEKRRHEAAEQRIERLERAAEDAEASHDADMAAHARQHVAEAEAAATLRAAELEAASKKRRERQEGRRWTVTSVVAVASCVALLVTTGLQILAGGR